MSVLLPLDPRNLESPSALVVNHGILSNASTRPESIKSNDRGGSMWTKPGIVYEFSGAFHCFWHHASAFARKLVVSIRSERFTLIHKSPAWRRLHLKLRRGVRCDKGYFLQMWPTHGSRGAHGYARLDPWLARSVQTHGPIMALGHRTHGLPIGLPSADP